MIKPEHLRKGDKVALVSLSWGGIGNPEYIHKYDIAKKRLLDEFGIELVPMPHALLGEKYVAEHPEDRASDLMEAFRDPTIKGIFCAIGRCTDCVMVVDGIPNVRTCITPLKSGMDVRTQYGVSDKPFDKQ